MNDVEAEIMRCAECSCECGRALRKLVDALADANMQEADEDETDEGYERESVAKVLLFGVATSATNGRRWRK